MEKKRSIRYDVLLISVLLCLSLIFLLIVMLTKREGAVVRVELSGETVKIVESRLPNFKITTVEDLQIAGALLK